MSVLVFRSGFFEIMTLIKILNDWILWAEHKVIAVIDRRSSCTALSRCPFCDISVSTQNITLICVK